MRAHPDSFEPDDAFLNHCIGMTKFWPATSCAAAR